MKTMISNMFSAAWFFAAVLPVQLLGAFLRWFMASLFGFGYKPRNDLVDGVYNECIELPVDKAVRLPWVNSGEKTTKVLGASERLYAYVAVANGWFGLAERVTDKGSFNEKRSYRYYYRRSLTGNWFAEIWSIWKSAFWATVLGVPFFNWMLNQPRLESSDQYGLILLVAGLLLIVFFLPRAILGRGTHLSAISLINTGKGGNMEYGCAQVINWIAGLGGISYVWVAFGLEWNVEASLAFLSDLAGILNISDTYREWGLQWTLAHPFMLVGGVLFFMVMVLIPAFFFWYVALSYRAERKAYAQLRALPLNQTQVSLFEGSAFQEVSSFAAPQIAFGGLLYLLMTLGVLGPVIRSLWSVFSS
ncbi:hypothetical protein [Stutzerimonas stutzeri]|uniref:hypothetical protein n=1 Tax=Stutzerimonas stutzeri TaxID=316 RepID=UPI00265CDAFA|nr:hypothetical protein [Stutzerimonas stutzeri]MCF6783406.1 hypothetical protein [Stutzerimonas stutzeri]